VRATLLRHVLVRREGVPVVDDGSPADDRAVGEGGARRLQVQRAFHGHGLHADTELAQVVRELLDADAVGAAADPDEGRSSHAEHVTAVERAGRLDVRDPQTEVPHGALHALGLAATLRGARPGDDREVAVHDDRVLDEDGVGVVVGRLDLHDVPPGTAEGTGVRLPLRAGEVHVDGGALDVGDDALGEARTGPADEGDGLRGHPPSLPGGGVTTTASGTR
jgi:hypothetical protein